MHAPSPSPFPTPTPIRLNIGCGRDVQAGWVNIDLVPLPGVDIVFDLETCREVRLPLKDDSVSEIRLFHVIEHIQDTLGLMEELYRVAADGCLCIIRVPHGASDEAWTDPTHRRPWFPGSFGFFSQPHYWRADYGYRGDWQPQKVQLLVPRAMGLDGPRLLRAVKHERNIVSEMVAELRAIKPARPSEKAHQQPAKINVHLVGRPAGDGEV